MARRVGDGLRVLEAAVVDDAGSGVIAVARIADDVVVEPVTPVVALWRDVAVCVAHAELLAREWDCM